MVRASEFISEDPGFDPLVGQGEGVVILSLRVNYLCRLQSSIGDVVLSQFDITRPGWAKNSRIKKQTNKQNKTKNH